ncbi:potassium transporter Kup [Brevibacterium salitolerans]|uniref:Probable potassium transport system protein Kup n=1 Tax=Brevibacterium salitolerans TaxID=1403566 RepID=A0ABN2WTC4_9MICO
MSPTRRTPRTGTRHKAHDSEGTAAAAPGTAPDDRTARGRGGSAAVIGSLGVVFGDIGTSPLYAMRTAFSMDHNAVAPTPANVYGIISLVLWTLTLIVTVKYVLLVTRADNDGQGGILALVALLRRRITGRRGVLVVTALGMLGAALFYGDSVITPAISVLSAAEGLTTLSPGLQPLVVPVSAGILALLFAVQPFGTGKVGRAFGPVMLGWFLVMAALGVPHVLAHPEILMSLSPHWAVELMLRQPFAAFVLLGAVVLTVTGAEALYADLGHFGARAVRTAWLAVALPALALVYLGQGASVLTAPASASDPFFRLAPSALQAPLLVLAMAATVIASQAVISGAFSVTRQAIRLGLLPRLTVRHASAREEGQIYLPTVNWALFAGVMSLVLVFSSSERLAGAYGLAVTGTLLLESAIFLVFARAVWGWGPWRIAAYVCAVGLLECLLFAANTVKLLVGGWLPLLVAGIVLVLMVTWRQGYGRVAAERRRIEGPLLPFVQALAEEPIARPPGTAVFPHPDARTAPLAMVQCVRSLRALPGNVVLVRLVDANVPHVPAEQRIRVEDLGRAAGGGAAGSAHRSVTPSRCGIVRVTVSVGFTDSPDIPRSLALAARQLEEAGIALDLDEVRYFLSVLALQPRRTHRLREWRQKLFLALEKNQADRTEAFRLPPDRTIVLGSELEV